MLNFKSQITNLKIIVAITLSLITTIILSKLFMVNSSQLNQLFISSLLKKTSYFLSRIFPKKNPTSQLPITNYQGENKFQIYPSPIQISPLPPTTISNYLKPNKIIFPSPTPIIINIQNQKSKNPMPTTKQKFLSCPTVSDQTYRSIQPDHSKGILNNIEQNPEFNIRLRGFVEVNEDTGLISRKGNFYGRDEKMPPQISTLFGGPRPKIIKTYRIYEWDYQNGKSAAPQTVTPNFKVHMIGLEATPGQKLVGLQAGRQIDTEGDVFMVLYATKSDIVFCHGISDYLTADEMPCYLFMFLDICVDPNLLATYEKDNTGGRNQLPVIAPGQVFGYSGSTDIKVVIRDSFSFMDPRYNEDWWDYGK